MNKRICLNFLFSGILATSIYAALVAAVPEPVQQTVAPQKMSSLTASQETKDDGVHPKGTETSREKTEKKEAQEEKSKDEKIEKKSDEKVKNGAKDKKDIYPKKEPLLFQKGDCEWRFGIKLRLPEFFYGKNLRLINDDNPEDRVIYFRHTIDFNAEFRYGMPKTKHDLVRIKMTVRNKGIWGDPESIGSTTTVPINALSTVFGEHKHGIPRHFLWIRELWAEFSLNDLLCLPFCHQHTLTFGAFSFELGRGIALGSAYLTDPSDLGFFYESAIDQYAFGAKLTGELIKDKLFYDLYASILDNKADTFDYTAQKILGQKYGFRQDPARGFGVINYVVASRLRWFPTYDNPKAAIRVEPYALYHHAPEQKIAFIGDAKSDLFTMGLASESEFDRFEWGFDTAYNFGRQTVFGWDSNVVQLDNVKGNAVVNNSRVRQAPPGEKPTQKSPLALKVSQNQNIINRSPQAASENGKEIGTNDLGTLINDENRFTDESFNLYRGYMFVFDMGYYFIKPDLRVCGGFGYASGDANPNKDVEFAGDSDVDRLYEGFIGLEETYSGTRVRSAFLLAGSGRIPRPLSFPSESVPDSAVATVSRFTNILYVGTSAYWRPSWSCRKWSFNPNLLAYWTDFSAPFFDVATVQNSTSRFARNFLGVEINAFIEAELMPDLRFFATGALFFPGSHYRDIHGRPLNKSQQTFLDNLDQTGITNERQPLLGFDKAYSANAGLEYRF